MFHISRVWLDGFQQAMAHMIEGIDANDAIGSFPQKYFFFIFEHYFLVLYFDEILYFIFLEFGWTEFNK